jgi:hypothetical protein
MTGDSRIEMYFDDHPPPHFHVITRKNERVSVVIDTLAIQAGEADSRDTAEAFAWARENGAELRWQEYSEEEPAKTMPPTHKAPKEKP